MGLGAVLDEYVARTEQEAVDIERLRGLAAHGDVWARSLPVHATGSAVILHPDTGRVLLRWHERMQAWLQVGGHADPGEASPLDIALREGREETGLGDLVPWPDPSRATVVQIVIVPVPAGRGEPVHEHADVRYVLATHRPDDAMPESAVARLRWLSLEAAIAEVAEDNLRTCLQRVAALHAGTTAEA
jgi:8-oxo-dGTP pyrophosphatase MutT (NUDIX family)